MGPTGQQVLLKGYGYDKATNTLAGEIWVQRSSSQPQSVQVFYSDARGLFASSQPNIPATYSGPGTGNYDIYKFSGNPIGGGIGMHFYLRYSAGASQFYDTNGGDWYHYRVWPQQKVPSGWLGRSVYQVMVDRFARPNNNNAACANMNDYCGGTWSGLEQKLDYIADMGFDAIVSIFSMIFCISILYMNITLIISLCMSRFRSDCSGSLPSSQVSFPCKRFCIYIPGLTILLNQLLNNRHSPRLPWLLGLRL
jgi:hypothetical protein